MKQQASKTNTTHRRLVVVIGSTISSSTTSAVLALSYICTHFCCCCFMVSMIRVSHSFVPPCQLQQQQKRIASSSFPLLDDDRRCRLCIAPPLLAKLSSKSKDNDKEDTDLSTSTNTTTTSSSSAAVAVAAPTPASQKQRRKYNIETDIGILAPTGFWDPLYLSDNLDQETYDQYRVAEIKHGRVAMLCVVGYVVPEIYKFPIDIAPGLSCQSIPNGVAAIDTIPSLGWMQIIFLIGAVDYYGFLGNFTIGQGATILSSASPNIYQQRQQSELAHGRLAMLASMELLRHDAQNYLFPNYDGLGDHLITGLPFLYP